MPGSCFEERQDWYRNFELSIERYRGLGIFEDLYTHGRFVKEVQPDESFGIIVSTTVYGRSLPAPSATCVSSKP